MNLKIRKHEVVFVLNNFAVNNCYSTPIIKPQNAKYFFHTFVNIFTKLCMMYMTGREGTALFTWPIKKCVMQYLINRHLFPTKHEKIHVHRYLLTCTFTCTCMYRISLCKCYPRSLPCWQQCRLCELWSALETHLPKSVAATWRLSETLEQLKPDKTTPPQKTTTIIAHHRSSTGIFNNSYVQHKTTDNWNIHVPYFGKYSLPNSM